MAYEGGKGDEWRESNNDGLLVSARELATTTTTRNRTGPVVFPFLSGVALLPSI
jgi:hypothetical protein